MFKDLAMWSYITKSIKKYNITNVQVSFIERMDLVYAAADIITRAGASSVSELSIVGKPVIFIPSP
jgi:UDP-N-acetylglucosamine--N-acetylmuramyl-(pentapeptide) pyrophosphoryl-undecaprenol N-acetylglucosamine transferase